MGNSRWEQIGAAGGIVFVVLFDHSNFAFANAWVMLASLSLTTGVISSRTGALPLWLGWAGVLIAGGLLAARAVWASSGIVFIPFIVCYFWLIAVSIVLIRRASAGQPAPRMPVAQQP